MKNFKTYQLFFGLLLILFVVGGAAYFLGSKSKTSEFDSFFQKQDKKLSPSQLAENKQKQDIADLGLALNMFKLDNGRYPSNQEGLSALVAQPANLPSWRAGGYIQKLPLDGSGKAYNYQLSQDGKTFKVQPSS